MNLVPLIDVLLILLIFFIVSFSMAKFETEHEITVPAGDAGSEPKRSVGEIIFNIREDGTVVMGSRVLDEEALKARFAEIASFNVRQAIIIRADENVDYKHMFRVLDLCYKAGLRHVSFASRRSEAAG